jgi:hypothetical protein
MNDNPYASPERSEAQPPSSIRWKLVLWIALICGLICGTAVSYITSMIDAHYPANLQLQPSTVRLLTVIRAALVGGVYLSVLVALVAAAGRWRTRRDRRRTRS